MKLKKEKSICRIDRKALSAIQAGANLVLYPNGSYMISFSDADRQQDPSLPPAVVFSTYDELVSWLATTSIDKQIIKDASPELYRQITHSCRYFFHKIFRHPR